MTSDLRDDLGRLESHYLEAPLDIDALVARSTAAGAGARRRTTALRAVGATALAGLLGVGAWGVTTFHFDAQAHPAASFTYPTQAYTPPPPQPADRAAVQKDVESAMRAALPAGAVVEQWVPAASDGALVGADSVITTTAGHGTWSVMISDDRMPGDNGRPSDETCSGKTSHPCTQREVPGGLLVEEDMPLVVNGAVVPNHRYYSATMIRPDHSVVQVSMLDAANLDTFGPKTALPLTTTNLRDVATSPRFAPLATRYLQAFGKDAYTRPSGLPTPVPVP